MVDRLRPFLLVVLLIARPASSSWAQDASTAPPADRPDAAPEEVSPASPAEEGRALLDSGRVDDAVSLLVDALDEAAEDPELLVVLGEALYRQGLAASYRGDDEAAGFAFLDARRFLERASSLSPGDPRPLLWRARVERALGDSRSARTLLEQALEAAPDHVDSLLELASLRYPEIRAAEQAGNLPGADRVREAVRDLYRRVLAAEPDNAYAMNGLGWVALSDEQNEEAETWFCRSLAADPGLEGSYRALANLLSGDSKSKRRLVERLGEVVAVARLRSAKAHDSRLLAKALLERGRAEIAARDPEAAEKDLTRAADLEPAFAPLASWLRARGFFSANDYERASLILREAIAETPDALLQAVAAEGATRDAALTARALADRGFKDGDLDAARELAGLAARLLGDSAVDWNNYAFFCRETRRYEESLAAYENALEADPANPSLLNDTAVILHYYLRRDFEHAADLYRQAIEEGRRVLDDPASDDFAREAARTAVRDATNNLEKLRAGVMKEGRGAAGRDG